MNQLLFSMLLVTTAAMATTFNGLGSGTVSAQFLSAPTLGNVSGVGSNAITFSLVNDPIGLWNQLRFDPIPFNNVSAGTPFLAGHLSYTNGRYDVADYAISLRLGTTAANGVDPNFSQTTTIPITLRVTPDTGTPLQNSDYVFFTDAQGLGSFRVIERPSNVALTGTVQIFLSFGSLNLSGFGNVTSQSGNGFTAPTVGALNANFVPNDFGNGTFTGSSPTSVPEPTTFGLMAITALAWIAWRRQCRLLSSPKVV